MQTRFLRVARVPGCAAVTLQNVSKMLDRFRAIRCLGICHRRRGPVLWGVFSGGCLPVCVCLRETCDQENECYRAIVLSCYHAIVLARANARHNPPVLQSCTISLDIQNTNGRSVVKW